MKKRLINFMKKDVVLCVAIVLAVISMFFNMPGKEYADFIDFRVLGILMSLMVVMAGFELNGVFRRLGEKLILRCNTTIKLSLVLVFLCFFLSMLLTNDVALITFVPFALLTLKMSNKEELIIPVVASQTVAANLGSMLTPMGNPQNLYLYGLSGMSMIDFIWLMLPYTIISAILLIIVLATLKKDNIKISVDDEKNNKGNRRHIIIYFVLFILCILTVIRVIPWYIVTSVVVIVCLIVDYRTVKETDYSLLFTFIAFFIFIGNLGEIEAVRNMLSSLIEGRELIVSVLSSQVVSNVPAAILLSGFTTNYNDLIIGVNIGGLGTLIASMASLISYKQLAAEYPDKKGKYFIYFTVMNVVFLIILLVVYFVADIFLYKI